jgi:hypothetical protein
MKHLVALVFMVAAAAAAPGCGPGRTAAATQPTPAAFDAAKSDAKALAIADEMSAKVGGAAAWNGVKQLSWDLKYTFDGQLKGWFRHAWDRWNGRHHFETIDQASGESKYQAMYDIFDPDDKGWVGNDRGEAALASERDATIKIARDRLKLDGYQLTMIHKLKDPGVTLTHVGQVKEVGGLCKPACDTIKITFDPAVGTDTYYVEVNTETKLPEVIEKQLGTGRVAFTLEQWTTVGGLQFPTRMQNVGMAGEVFQFENIEIGDPDDALYIVPVR